MGNGIEIFSNCTNVKDCTGTVNQTISVLAVRSFNELNQLIEDNGGSDKEELKNLAVQIEILVEKLKNDKNLQSFKDERVIEKITKHLSKHGWFYGAILSLIGAAII